MSRAATDASATGQDDGENEQNLVSLLDEIVDGTDGDTVTIDDILGVLGRASFGPLFVIVSLVAVLPTGAIPGMSVLTGTIMLILSLQLLFNQERIWLPKVLTRRGMPREQLVDGLEKARGKVKTLSRFIGPRLTALVQPPLIQLVALAGVIVSLTMFPLALVPFGAFPAGLTLMVMGMGLAVRDGVLLLIAAAMAIAALVASYTLWPL